MTQIRSLVCVLLLAGCAGDDGTGDGQGTEAGQDPGATLTTEYDASSLCTAGVDRVEFASRRTNCWDPELPCTLAQNPPWISGTSADCADISGSMHWETTVLQTGQYETQLRALSGSTQAGLGCFAPNPNVMRTNVANADLDAHMEFQLVEIAASGCASP